MRRWRHWSLRRRVIVVSAAAVTVAIIAGVTAYAIALDRILYTAAEDAALVQANQISARIVSGSARGENALDVPSQGSLLQLLDSDHDVVASSDPEGRSPLTGLAPRAGSTRTEQVPGLPGEVGEPYAIVAQGVVDPSGTAYVVVVASPLRVETATVRSATLLLVIGAGVLLALLLLLISRIMRRALEPVERIRRDVDRVTQLRGRGRVTVPPSGDEIARLATTMNDMLDRLDRADASTRRFVSDASHELRSPLATIRAALEVSMAGQDDARQDAARQDAARQDAADPERDALMLAETLRMQGLVNDLLTLAKADDGIPMSADEVDVDDVVAAEVRRLRATREQPVDASISAARIIGDRGRIEQVVRNLVDNAVRHTTGSISLAVATSGDEVVLTVDNEGEPIPVDQRELVFERFTRLEGSRERDRGGSGLGLAIARTLVEAHGGQVRATQTAAGNCRFEVRLPTERRRSTGAGPLTAQPLSRTGVPSATGR